MNSGALLLYKSNQRPSESSNDRPITLIINSLAGSPKFHGVKKLIWAHPGEISKISLNLKAGILIGSTNLIVEPACVYDSLHFSWKSV